MDHLREIERLLAGLDGEALSFDHDEADRSKESLLRTADQAIALCSKITSKPARGEQEPTGWRRDWTRTEAEAQVRLEALKALSKGSRMIEMAAPEIVTIGGKKL